MKAPQDFTLHHVNVAIGLLEMPELHVEMAIAHLRVAQKNLIERENNEDTTD
tara:strand:- start:221 stop:376 length:156 start_codon:yes stop_codon:yes gene_type:complete